MSHRRRTRAAVSVYTPGYIAQRMEAAADTLKRLPFNSNDYPMQHRAQWPEIVRTPGESYGWSSPGTYVMPTSTEIDAMDEALQWLFFVPADTRRIVWRKAMYPYGSTVRMARARGVCRQTIYRQWREGLLEIAGRLSSGEK